MAQKRMIDKKISVSEQVADLSLEAQLIFTWSIPHSDDVGILSGSHRTLKALIIPMWSCSLDKFDKWVKEIIEKGLWCKIEHKNKDYYVLTKFGDHQILRKDRQPQTLLDIAYSKKPKISWNTLEKEMKSLGFQTDVSGFQMDDNGFQMDTEEKGSEEKGSEEKGSELDKPHKHLSYLLKLPEKDKKEFAERFNISEAQVLDKADDLLNYCRAKGRTYKNYRSFLLNALKKDFPQLKTETLERDRGYKRV